MITAGIDRKITNHATVLNGEYYVAYGRRSGGRRSWVDARKYGFISGGGGRFYSRTMEMLAPGDRIWVYIPSSGYVGVGRVTESRQPMINFEVDTDGGRRLALDVIDVDDAQKCRERAADPDIAEYVFRVQWLDTKPQSQAIWEAGFFSNQNTVCRPQTPTWRHTIKRLKSAFPDWNREE